MAEPETITEAARPGDPDFATKDIQFEILRAELSKAKAEFAQVKLALDQSRSSWVNWTVALPIITGVLAGAFTVWAGIRAEKEKAAGLLAVEEYKSQSAIIVEISKTGDEYLARSNLEFFMNAGLLPDFEPRLRERIEAGEGLTLPTAAGPEATFLLRTMRLARIGTSPGDKARKELAARVDADYPNRCAGLPEPGERINWYLQRDDGEFIAIFSCVLPNGEDPALDDYVVGAFNGTAAPISIGIPYMDATGFEPPSEILGSGKGIEKTQSVERSQAAPNRGQLHFQVEDDSVPLDVFVPRPPT